MSRNVETFTVQTQLELDMFSLNWNVMQSLGATTLNKRLLVCHGIMCVTLNNRCFAIG